MRKNREDPDQSPEGPAGGVQVKHRGVTPREQEQSTAREALKLAVVFGVCRVLRCGNSEGQEVGRGSPGVWIHPTGSRAAWAL